VLLRVERGELRVERGERREERGESVVMTQSNINN
jgi:hypothetical protein